MDVSSTQGAREPWLAPSSVGPRRTAPEDAAGWISRYTFWWVFPSIKAANEKDKLVHEDMPSLPSADDPQQLFKRCSELWRSQRGKSARIMRCVCWKVQWRLFLYSFLHGWTFLFLMTIDPLMLRVLLQAAQHSSTEPAVSLPKQLLLAAVLSLSMLVRVTCMEVCYFASTRVQNNVRSVLVHAIFRKALAIPDHELDVGRVTNLMATDADKVGKWSWLLFSLAQWTWTLLSLPVILYFLYELVGQAAFIGVGAIIVGAVTNHYVGQCLGRYTKRIQDCRDDRSGLMNEMVRGIRTVKLQVWEPVWHQRISEAREREMRAIVLSRVLQALNSLLGSILQVMVPVSIFAWYTLVDGHSLDAATAFTTLAWISTLQWSLQALPGIYNMIANLKPSIDRIDDFLTAPVTTVTREADGVLQPDVVIQCPDSWRSEVWLQTEEAARKDIADGNLSRVVEVRDASFGYIQPGSNPMTKLVLEHVNLTVNTGSLVMIAGATGSGKSTLLASLAGARPALNGVCKTVGRRAFVSQKPFLLNASVKDNILFGLPMNEERYTEAVERSALPADIRDLAAGDATVVGESGVQLSGGQKARVALARAVYADVDVVFLDDVLSAVDAHTGRYLWDACIIGLFVQQRKTVVLVSHQLQYLSRPEVTSVMMLRETRVHHCAWSELAQSGDELLKFVQECEEPKQEDAPSPEGGGQGVAETNDDSVSNERPLQGRDSSAVSIQECQRAVAKSLSSLAGRRIDTSLIENVRKALAGESEAIECMREGMISWSDFKVYLDAFGSCWSVSLMVILMCFSAVSQVFSNIFLAAWTDGGRSVQAEHSDVGIYALIGMATSVASCFQEMILTLCALAASRSIHTQMLRNLLTAPLSFFDGTPTGRFINRFLQDVQNIDNFVPNSISDQITRSLNIVTQLSLVYIEAPWVLCTLPVMIVPYIMIYKRMRIPNRDSRRLESIAHSPVYAHFADALHGRETIRAFAAEARFENENVSHISVMATGLYGNNAVNKWAQALTTQWGCMLYLTCAFSCVGLSHAGVMSGGQMGLVLLYASQLQRAMMDYMMGAADLETKFVSVERVAEYTRLEQEESVLAMKFQSSDLGQLSDWPKQANIHLEAVALRYRLCRPLVLRGVSLRIEDQAKVAFCGRTGCGKSSLFGALSRLYPLAGGSVLIDGVDIGSVPLDRLRACVRVVSQDAFLISGSLRQNLAMRDNGAATCDAVLWHSLEAVGLAQKVKALEGGLEFKVGAGGQNFSEGERQLLTLARVLVPVESCSSLDDWRPPRILLCDEATANVDLAADECIHKIVLSLNSTVLMICHRLQHISRFEQVVVLESGVVAETGSPQELLEPSRVPSSRLSKLRADAGIL
eukprot:TRINITY_DN24126_c0_g1_i1.p1 TRINITY_DN24126_c0_g1~~TRINITY_DN24126_c0_g1_i1.p1  ORF type:complete len:1366 (+),score=195.29 TRINITY_DN24126_c0_g1_i1:71-4168(+)